MNWKVTFTGWQAAAIVVIVFLCLIIFGVGLAVTAEVLIQTLMVR